MSAQLRRLETLGRQLWPPISLGVLIILTWAVVGSVDDTFLTDTTMRMFLALIVVLALQIFSGNSGVLSFGHLAFVAIGAYTSALLTIPTEAKEFAFQGMPSFLQSWIFPAELGALEGTLVGGGFALVFAMLTAAPVARLAGIPASIATLAILVIVYVFNTQTTSITRGDTTMIGVPQTTTIFAVMIWVLVFLVVAFVFKSSRIGLRLRGSRENEAAAKSVGVHVGLERAMAWTLSGFVAGVAGALYAHYFVTFSPTDFHFNNGFNLVIITVAMLIVGGMTSVTGAVVGCYSVMIVYSLFNRWEVLGFLGVTPPSGTANLAVAALLLGALVLRPSGLTGGREIAWPAGWNLRWLRPARLGGASHAGEATSHDRNENVA